MEHSRGPSDAPDDGFDPFGGPPIEATAPTTEAQREVLLAVDLGGTQANLAYNEAVSLTWTGPQSADDVTRAVRLLVARHEALRTTFSPDRRTFVVAAATPPTADQPHAPDVVCEDLSALAPQVRAARRAEVHGKAVSSPFDLERGPLVRASFLVLEAAGSARRLELVLTAHHAVCDGWSLGVLLREFALLVGLDPSGSVEPGAGPLPEAPSFVRHALAMHDTVRGPGSDRDELFWAEVLGDAPPVLDLPTDRPRGASPDALRDLAAARSDRPLPERLTAAVEALGRSSGTGTAALGLAAFAVWLARITGQDDFLVGVPAAAQAHTGEPGLVGHCVHMLPVRIPVDTGRPVPDLAGDVRRALLDGFEHQNVAFGTLVQRLRLPRTPGRVPLIPVVWNLDQELRLGGADAAAEVVGLPRIAEQFELFVNVTPRGGRLELEATYASSLFDEATVSGFLESFEALLDHLVEEPGTPARDLRMVSARQRRTQLEVGHGNHTDGPEPPSTPLARILGRASATPDAVAVEADGGGTLRYDELVARADALAGVLRQHGVGPGDRVGLHMGRGADLVVAMLGTWRAGAAWVPLDPALPRRRLETTARAAHLRAVVEGRAGEPLDVGSAAGIQVGAASTPSDASTSSGTAASEPPPSATAYVLHTSGTTGTPKGVAVHHGALDNLLQAMADRLQVGPGTRLLTVTGSSFDIAILEWLLPLVRGGRVVVPPEDAARDGRALARCLEAGQVDLLQATPSGWRTLLDAGWAGRPQLTALCGGEALPLDLGQRLAARVGRLFNVYGPTETTIWSTIARIDPAEPFVPIGRPLDRTFTVVRDPAGHLLPPGARTGELWIAGAGVAQGYLDQPEETARHFVESDPGDGTVRRFYRTGDTVRLRSDGRLEFIGRKDDQVKVRGHRIELGEVEAALVRLDAVSEAVAAVRGPVRDDPRLVAWVVATDPSAPPDEAAVREALRRELPEAHVPQHVVVVDAIPRTPNGKTDRNALPAPGLAAARAAIEPHEVPSTETEVRLAAVWQEVLHCGEVARGDGFFDLGGHSLSAVRLMARIAEVFGLDLPLRTVFQAQTLRDLASRIDVASVAWSPSAAASPPSETADRTDDDLERFEF